MTQEESYLVALVDVGTALQQHRRHGKVLGFKEREGKDGMEPRLVIDI
jgi:hypothetical protein